MASSSEYRTKLNAKLEDLQFRKRVLKEIRAKRDACKLELAAAEEAQLAVQTVAQAVQTQAHERIASVVSRCLSSVFEEPYKFKIIFERKRGRTEAQLVFERNDENVDPMSASGGGVVDVAAFALRMSCLLLAKPKLRRVLVLDEPMKMLSEGYRERVATLFTTLAEELGVQLIIVTHQPEFVQGHLVRL